MENLISTVNKIQRTCTTLGDHGEASALPTHYHVRFRSLTYLSHRSDSIGAGGVIKDECGNWTGGFAINLGKGQILEVEIRGLFFGLKLAVQKGINNLIVEMDSATAVLLFQNSNILGLYPLATLLSSCWELMHQIDNCVVKRVYGEKNMIADCLAMGSFNFDLGLVSFADIPRWVGAHLKEDLMGVHRTRLIAVV